MKITTLFHLTVATVTLAATPLAKAQTYNGIFNYNTTDVLFVLSVNGGDSIYYDLGNVSQFLNQPSGYQTQVTGWNPTIAESALGVSSLTGVNFNLGAGDPDTTYDAWATYTANETLSSAYELGNTIDANGWNLNNLSQDGIVDQQVPQSGDIFGDNYVVLSSTQKIAWDYKDNDNQWGTGISGGSFDATVIPETAANIPFYQFAANSTTLEGYFSLTSDGTLDFSTDPVPTPEPSTYALGGAALLALVGFRRFKHKNA